VPLDADGEIRLNAFIEWAFLQGVAPPRLVDFRRIAIDLLEMAGPGRVTESHILHLIGTISDRPDGRELTALIEEVGEGLLRFQATRRTPQTITAQRSGRAASSSTPFVPRPEQRVAGELRPPVVVPAPGDVPPPARVSFATGSQPPPRRPTPDSRPAVPARPRSAPHFRCLRCKTMVTADPAGACPRCGTPAPRIASAPIKTMRRRAPGRWIVPAAVAAAILITTVAAAPRIADRLRHPSDSAAGVYPSAHLGLRLAFPDDWRHLRDADHVIAGRPEMLAPVFADPMPLLRARFFRGALSSEPVAEVILVVGARTSEVTDAALEAWGRGAAATPGTLAEPVRALTGVPALEIERCAYGASQPRGGLRCSGAASPVRAEIFLFGTRNSVELVLFLGRAGFEATAAEAAELVAGLEPGT
jgi:hypothetical protein